MPTGASAQGCSWIACPREVSSWRIPGLGRRGRYLRVEASQLSLLRCPYEVQYVGMAASPPRAHICRPRLPSATDPHVALRRTRMHRSATHATLPNHVAGAVLGGVRFLGLVDLGSQSVAAGDPAADARVVTHALEENGCGAGGRNLRARRQSAAITVRTSDSGPCRVACRKFPRGPA